MDYYRGKVKSVYEKEPYFKVVTHDVSCNINIFQFSSVWQDFVRNIPLSETNVYDMNNLSRLKKRFNSIVQDKWGRETTPDPLKPSRVSIKRHLPSKKKTCLHDLLPSKFIELFFLLLSKWKSSVAPTKFKDYCLQKSFLLFYRMQKK